MKRFAVLLAAILLLASCLSPSPQKLAEIPGIPWPLPPDPEGRAFLLREPCQVPAGAIVLTPDFWQELVAYILEMEQLRVRDVQVARRVYR